MSYLDTYIRYIKDNPRGYWFKRKLYGWGWTPATWQGWFVILAFLGLVLLVVLRFDPEARTDADVLRVLLPQVAFLIILLIVICYRTGEKPRWQWGLPNEKDTKERNDS